jgi:tetrahydromethanopterin S-methyltransferase subunit B
MIVQKKIKTLVIKKSFLHITHKQGENLDISITDIEKIYLSPKKPSLNNWIYFIIITIIIGISTSFFIGLIKATLVSLLLLSIIFKLLNIEKKYFLVIKFSNKDSYNMQIPTKDKTEIIKLIWDIRAIKLNDN